ncbi:MAG: methyltransferase domain-containing protein [Bifidobacteriaceae bacterium]|jgi:ubiquinone/menaquinone biosynthesis C-methylase UbiE|nr:methyltransferase domain-containing protein [Bifidobacteriaceae bacterium]
MAHYLHGHGPAVTRAHAGRTVANSAPHLAAILRPRLRVLDVGSAGGALTRDLAARVAPGRVVGVDLSDDAVRAAQADPSRPGNLRFEVADATALPFGDSSFDLVHLHQVLHHLADPVAAIREATRVAGPTGWAALREADFGAVFWHPAATAWEAWQEVMLESGRAEGSALDAGRRLVAWLGEAGLADRATVTGSLWTYPGLAPAAEIAASWADRLVEPRFADHVAAAGIADRTELTATAKGLVEWAARPDAFFAMPHVEALIGPEG